MLVYRMPKKRQFYYFGKRKKNLRWIEYISERFKDHRKVYNVMKGDFAGPPIMKDEMQAAIRKMKLDKATGSGSISVELLEALEDSRIEITTLLNEINDTVQIPQDISKSIFIALPKKLGAT